MYKKIDYYILKLFFIPFIIVFTILFFILIIQFIWSQMNNLVGNFFKILPIIKLIFYFGISLVPLITPISILLSSIITYGNLSENYELSAMKSIGISLWRIMRSIFILSIFLAILLFLFSDYIIPNSQKQAKNIIYNFSIINPNINIIEGSFVNIIPNMIIKIDKKIGKNNNLLKGIFIRQNKYPFDEENTILAELGYFIFNKKNQFLKIHLINGILYSQKKNIYSYKNSYKVIKFDTFTENLNISEYINSNIDKENFEDNYIILKTQDLIKKINIIKNNNKKFYKDLSNQIYPIQKNTYISNISFKKIIKMYNNLNLDNKKKILQKTKNQLHKFYLKIKIKKEEIKNHIEYLAKYEFELQKKFTFPISCILMFFIGAPLGGIVQKEGMYIPILISLIIFIIYFTFLTIGQNFSEKGEWPIWIGAWLPNLIIFPIAIWLTKKIMMDNFIINLNYLNFFLNKKT